MDWQILHLCVYGEFSHLTTKVNIHFLWPTPRADPCPSPSVQPKPTTRCRVDAFSNSSDYFFMILAIYMFRNFQNESYWCLFGKYNTMISIVSCMSTICMKYMYFSINLLIFVWVLMLYSVSNLIYRIRYGWQWHIRYIHSFQRYMTRSLVIYCHTIFMYLICHRHP